MVDAAGRLEGILTEGDLLHRAEIATERKHWPWLDFLLGPSRLAEEYVRTHGRKVGEIISTENVVSAAEDTSLVEIVRLMERHRIKRLPVLRDSALVGIVTRADLVRALARLVDKQPPWAFDDDRSENTSSPSSQKQAGRRARVSRLSCPTASSSWWDDHQRAELARRSGSLPRMCRGSRAFAIASSGSSRSLEPLSAPRITREDDRQRVAAICCSGSSYRSYSPFGSVCRGGSRSASGSRLIIWPARSAWAEVLSRISASPPFPLHLPSQQSARRLDVNPDRRQPLAQLVGHGLQFRAGHRDRTAASASLGSPRCESPSPPRAAPAIDHESRLVAPSRMTRLTQVANR